jgi:hypothetical protein
LAGHSLKEYNALQAAGAFSFEDGLRLVQKRGELMSRTKKGALAAVLKLTHKEIQQCIEEHGLTKKERKSEIISESEKNSQTNEIDEKIAASSQAATYEIEVKPMQNKEDDVLNKKIIEWNNKYPVGAQVVVAGYEDKLKTRTKAMVLFGHRAAIYMQGYKGYFDLDDVTSIKISEKAVSA